MPSDQPTGNAASTPQTPARVSPPPLMAGAKLAPIIPHNIEEAWRIAQYFEASGLGPKDMRQAKQLLIAIMAGSEVGLPPIQAVLSIALINGRPTMWGDGLLAIVLSQGFKVEEWMEGTGDDRIAYCKVTRPDTKQVIERFFSVEDAKEARLWGKEGPWQTYRRRMLQMRARSWAIRDGAADVTRGIMVREEAEDFDEDAVVTNVDGSPLPSVADHLAADTAAGEDAKIDIVDADYEEQAAAQPDPTPEPEEITVKPKRSGLKNPPPNASDNGGK